VNGPLRLNENVPPAQVAESVAEPVMLTVSPSMQVPAMVANPFAAMQAAPRIQMKKLMLDAPSLIVACGLAMRRFDP